MLSDRTRNGLEKWLTQRPDPETPSWAERISTWGVDFLAKGAERFTAELEPGMIDQMREALLEIRNIEGMPASYQAVIDKAFQEGNILQVVLGWILTIAGLVLSVFHLGGPQGRIGTYVQDQIVRSARIPIGEWIRLNQRSPGAAAVLKGDMADLGWTDERLAALGVNIAALLPLDIAMTAWRRNPDQFGRLLEDLSAQGWSDDRIEAAKEATKAFPSVQDVVTWLAREVFEPDMIAKYGLDSELPAYSDTMFPRLGIDEEQATNYWRAHWQHATWFQIVQMRRRELITDDDVSEWFRLVEIPPFWREMLTATIWEIPTRVDVRRWWDMRTITKDRLRQVYGQQGYQGDDLDDYVTWTLVFTAWPDLVARYQKGWINLDAVRAELVSYGMPAERVEELIQTKIKAAAPERVVKERDVTRTDILKGVKQNRITRLEAVGLLQDLGYSEDEALFILDVNIPVDQVDDVVALRQLSKTDILKGLAEEVLTQAEARARLLELRYSPRDADLLLAIFNAALAPPPEVNDREASKADVVLAVKKGLITPEEAYLMLQAIGYTPAAAEFILWVRAEESPFSPTNLTEFRERTAAWRGIVAQKPPVEDQELRDARDLLVQQSEDVVLLEEAVRLARRELDDFEIIPEENTAKLRAAQKDLRQAQSELRRVQGEYSRLVAAWRIRQGQV